MSDHVTQAHGMGDAFGPRYHRFAAQPLRAFVPAWHRYRKE